MRVHAVIFVFFLFVISMSSLAYATEEQPICERILLASPGLPPALRRNPKAKRYNIEVEEAGIQIKHGWVPKRNNEIYLFVIDSYGAIWVSPQYLKKPFGQTRYVATHRAIRYRIERFYKELAERMVNEDPMRKIEAKDLLKNLRFLAAGQLRQRYGVSVAFDNRSNFMRGKKEHLLFAHRMFNLNGHIFPLNVELFDFSEKDFKCPEEIHELRIKLLSKANEPGFQTLRARWEAILNALHKKFPKSSNALHIDDQAFIEAFDGLIKEMPEMKYEKGPSVLALRDANESLDLLIAKQFEQSERAERYVRNFEIFLEYLDRHSL